MSLKEIVDEGRKDWWNGPYATFRCPSCGGRMFGTSQEPGKDPVVYCHTGACRWNGPRSECFWLPPGKRADVFGLEVMSDSGITLLQKIG